MGRFVFTTAIAVWLGTVVSFSFIVLPTVHRVMEGHTSELLNKLFPRYYLTGVFCGMVALAAVSLPPATPLLPVAERLRLAFPVVVSLLCTLGAHRLLMPRLAKSNRQDPSYERLHRFAAMLNSTVLAMLILATAAITSH